MTQGTKTGRNWRPIIAITLLSAMIIGLLLYMAVPPLLTYEKLELFQFYGFTSNSEGQIEQTAFHFFNNGTRALRIDSFWINTTLLNSTELIWIGESTIFHPGSGGSTGTIVCLIPRASTYRKGTNYNFTVGTSSGKRYSFVYRCDDASVSPENLTVVDWQFVPGNWPEDPPYLLIRYRNDGKTPLIVTGAKLDGQNINQPMPRWTGPGSMWVVSPEFDWRPHTTYTVTIETSVGNTYNIVATSP